MSNQLIIRNDQSLSVTVAVAAQSAKIEALAIAATVQQVTNSSENGLAVSAQTKLVELRKLVETSRKEVKAPILEFGRKIDGAASEFLKEVEAELLRVSTLAGDFMALEKAKERAAMQLQQAALDKLEAEKLAKIKSADSHDEIEEIQSQYNDLAKAASEVTTTPLRAEGQVAKDDWEIEVLNEFDLAKYHPQCVKITPKMSEIKALLKEGIQVRGIKAKPVVKSQIRAVKAVDVTDWTPEIA